jgi:hypothetical protein
MRVWVGRSGVWSVDSSEVEEGERERDEEGEGEGGRERSWSNVIGVFFSLNLNAGSTAILISVMIPVRPSPQLSG